LQIERLLVPDDAEPADFQRRTVNRYSHASSNFSSRSLMWDRNRPASAPSISR
jgi:hypothetical protein